MAANLPTAWTETFLIGITKRDGSEIQYGAIVDPSSLSISGGGYPVESIPNSAGGRIRKQSPQEDIEISFDIYEVDIVSTTGTGLAQQFEGGTFDTSEPMDSDNAWPVGVDRARDLYRIAILFTNDPAATTASGTTATLTESRRRFFNNCNFVGYEESFSDGIAKQTVTFKVPALAKLGTIKNYGFQSGNQTALVALTAYTLANYPA